MRSKFAKTKNKCKTEYKAKIFILGSNQDEETINQIQKYSPENTSKSSLKSQHMCLISDPKCPQF